jgi:hypothetical protein
MEGSNTSYTSGSEGRFVGRDPQGDLYTAGLFSAATTFSDTITVTSANTGDIFLAKYDAGHRLQWVRHIGAVANQYPDDAVLALAVDKHGNAYLAGACTGPFLCDRDIVAGAGPATRNFWLVKYTPAGILEWRSLWDTGPGQALAADMDGSICLALTGAADSLYLRKYSPDGTVVWTKPLLTRDSPNAPAINATATCLNVGDNGDIFVGGRMAGTALVGGVTSLVLNTTSATDLDGFAAKFTAGGMPRWGVTNGQGGTSDNVSAITTDLSGNLYLTGHSNSGIFLAKFTSSGARLWTMRPFKSTMLTIPAAVCVNRANGTIYLAGQVADTLAFVRADGPETQTISSPALAGNRQTDIFIVWFDSTGRYLGYFKNSTSGPEELRQAVMDEKGGLYATGSSRNGAVFGPDTLKSASNSGDYFAAKFLPTLAPPVGGGRGREEEQQVDLNIQNVPGPLGIGSVIRFTLPGKGRVLLQIMDNNGKRMAVLEDRTMPAGNYVVKFDATKLDGGTYQCWLTAGDEMVVRQIIVIK